VKKYISYKCCFVATTILFFLSIIFASWKILQYRELGSPTLFIIIKAWGLVGVVVFFSVLFLFFEKKSEEEKFLNERKKVIE
jgi:hypothetical protein